jgi:16S rRNA (uracil1498-N3)-methyltransferase
VSTPPLFLLDPLPGGDTFVLGGDEGRHAARVRRLGVGERLQVGDGCGALTDCVIDALVPDGLQVRVLARREIPAPDPRLVVVQALPKGDRAELAVELLTELGADEIVPWAAARSVAQWQGPRGDKALAKWRRTAAEAAKQSRRAWVPIVSELATTAAVAARLAAGIGFVLHEAAELALAGAGVSGSDEVIIVVGPEGGITDDELAAFGAAGAATVRLGEPVLRTSTAGAAALAVLSARSGRWS